MLGTSVICHWRSVRYYFTNYYTSLFCATLLVCNLSLVLGEERAEGEGVGARRSTATLGESGQLDGYIITSVLIASGGDMVVVEARQLMDNGLSHIQVGRC